MITRLHHAAKEGLLEEVLQMLREGHEADAFDEFGEGPLHVASASGHLEVASVLLISNADPLKRSENDFSALDLASRGEMASLLRICSNFEVTWEERPCLFHVPVPLRDVESCVGRVICACS